MSALHPTALPPAPPSASGAQASASSIPREAPSESPAGVPAGVPVEVPAEAPLDTCSPPPALARGQVFLRTLGAAEIHVGGFGMLGPSAERLFSLLVLVAMTPDHVIARTELLALLWPASAESGARHSLRQHLYRLRSLGLPIVATRASVALDPACLVPTFALRRTAELFDRDVLRGGEPFGHLFAGWQPSLPGLQHWVERQRDRLQMDVRRVLVPEVRRLRDRADWLECERWARTVLEFDPYNDDAMLALAEAIAMQGGRVSATSMLDGFVRETGLAGSELLQDVEAAQRRIGRATKLRHEAMATPKLVGRDAELARLDALTMAALQGETQVVQIVGPTGMGKTELAYEATRRAVILGFARCIVRVTRPMGEVPLGTIARLVRDLLKLPGSLGVHPECLALLRRLEGEIMDAPQHKASDVPTHWTISESVAQLATAIAEESPLSVLIDDADRVDAESRAVLERVIEFVGSTRLLWLSTARTTPNPDEPPEDSRRHSTVVLAGLSLPACIELASAVTSATGRTLSPEDANRVALHSDRTPLHVVTAAREALVQGIVASRDDRLRDALRRQILSLPTTALLALKCLTVFACRVHATELDSALDLPFPERFRAISLLIEAGLLFETSQGQLFCHDAVAEVVSELISVVERKLLCSQIASALTPRLRIQFTVERATTLVALATQSEDWPLLTSVCLEFCDRLAAAGRAGQAANAISHAACHLEDADARRALLSLQIAVGKRASAWQRVVSATDTLRELSQGQPSADPEEELTEIEAHLRAELLLDGKRHAYRALQLADDSSLSYETRYRGVRLAIGAASDLFDTQLASSAFSTLTLLRETGESLSPDATESLMQYHTIFGNHDEARHLAHSFASLRTDATFEPATARAFCNAAYVLRVLGETRLATDWLAYAYRSPELVRLPGRRAFAAWQLSLIAADHDDLIEATSWNRELQQVVSQELSAENEIWFLHHQLRIELLASGYVADATIPLQRIHLERGQPTRSLLYATALALRGRRVIRDQALHSRLIEEGLDYLRRFGSFVGMDLLAVSLLECLQQRGEFERANSVLHQYLRHDRREGSHPAPLFHRLVPQLRKAATAHLQ